MRCKKELHKILLRAKLRIFYLCIIQMEVQQEEENYQLKLNFFHLTFFFILFAGHFHSSGLSKILFSLHCTLWCVRDVPLFCRYFSKKYSKVRFESLTYRICSFFICASIKYFFLSKISCQMRETVRRKHRASKFTGNSRFHRCVI